MIYSYMTHSYGRHSVFELDVALPKSKELRIMREATKIIALYGGPLSVCLQRILQQLSDEREEKQICLEIAKQCNVEMIHQGRRIDTRCDEEKFDAVELEVGERQAWMNLYREPYREEKELLKESLGDAIHVRLCRGVTGYT